VSTSLPIVRVNRKAGDRLASGHLWIFASDVVERGEAKPGDVVRIVDGRGRSLGVAHYSSQSQITLRLLSRHSEANIDVTFLRGRIEAAQQLRTQLVHDTTAYRLVYADGDLLPGLIIDRYSDRFVVQLLDQGMDRLTGEITSALIDLYSPAGIVARNDSPVRGKEGLPIETKVLAGTIPPEVAITMNGLELGVDLLAGQKTGIFLDQRENYLAVRRYVQPGARALDCFTATGGFALHVAKTCESVEAVDSSAAALEKAMDNAAKNGLENIMFQKADVLEYLPGLVGAHRVFDLVVVDPPAFTKSRESVEGAARGYKEVNLRALRLLRKGGILVSCSCSHHMTEAHLLEVVAQAGLDCGKRLRVLERRTQAQDHPILLTMAETAYLKCLILQVAD
jgi:23S rRNA (cytosine1962-C5)-methyltransferase